MRPWDWYSAILVFASSFKASQVSDDSVLVDNTDKPMDCSLIEPADCAATAPPAAAAPPPAAPSAPVERRADLRGKSEAGGDAGRLRGGCHSWIILLR